MEAEADNLTENISNCQASGVDTQGGRGSAPHLVIKWPDEAIFTGFYKNFQQLPNDNKYAIFDERKISKIQRKICYKRRSVEAQVQPPHSKRINILIICTGK